MVPVRTILLEGIPTPLLNHLDSRDVAVWVLESFVEDAGAENVAEIMRLPWRVVLSESSETPLLDALEKPEDPSDPLVRRRGFVQIVETSPSDVLLPPRCLPIYLLNGRDGEAVRGLAALTRRLTMLEALRRLEVKELYILSGSAGVFPSELGDLWQDGLRTIITVVSESPAAATELENWRTRRASSASAAYLSWKPKNSVDNCSMIIEMLKPTIGRSFG